MHQEYTCCSSSKLSKLSNSFSHNHTISSICSTETLQMLYVHHFIQLAKNHKITIELKEIYEIATSGENCANYKVNLCIPLA